MHFKSTAEEPTAQQGCSPSILFSAAEQASEQANTSPSVQLHRCERSELIAMICLPRKCHRISLVYFKGERRGKSEAGLRQRVPGGTSQRNERAPSLLAISREAKKKNTHTHTPGPKFRFAARVATPGRAFLTCCRARRGRQPPGPGRPAAKVTRRRPPGRSARSRRRF